MTSDGLTVLQRALMDLDRQKEAFEMRKKQVAPPWEPGDVRLLPDTMDALCAPLRIEVTFDDPIATRQQLEVLAAAIVEAQVVTMQHDLGINRQRLNLRHIMQTAAEALVLLQGKTPSRLYHRVGRRKRRVKQNASSSS